jgi:hypothetical protein
MTHREFSSKGGNEKRSLDKGLVDSDVVSTAFRRSFGSSPSLGCAAEDTNPSTGKRRLASKIYSSQSYFPGSDSTTTGTVSPTSASDHPCWLHLSGTLGV